MWKSVQESSGERRRKSRRRIHRLFVTRLRNSANRWQSRTARLSEGGRRGRREWRSRKNKDDKKGAGKHERTKTAWKESVASHPKRATVSHIAANILHCTAKSSKELCAISGMMAMLDLGGRDPWVCCPTRFQECVIFHFLLTGNRPEMAAEKRRETGITQRRRRVERI